MFQRIGLAFVLLGALTGASHAQGILQGGTWTAGHVPIYGSQGTNPPVLQDSGPASGPTYGFPGASEGLYQVPTPAGGGTPPFANSGTGPFGTNWCDYDAPITNATGYHFLCMSPNAQGGGLIAYGAGGGASALPLVFNLNGIVWSPTGGVTTVPLSAISGLGTGVEAMLEVAPNTSGGAILAGAGGYLPVSQMPALTGNVTSAAGSTTTTIANNAVTNAMLAAVGSNTVKGNSTNSSANAQDMAMPNCTQLALQWTAGSGFSCPTDFPSSAILGTTTNNNAATGYVGEYEYDDVGSGAAVALSNAAPANVASEVLTAGDWDCTGNVVQIASAGAATTLVSAWISTLSATAPSQKENGGMSTLIYPTSSDGTENIVSAGYGRFLLSATTPIYLETTQVWTGSGATMQAYGFLGCRRMR